jgi:RNA polymerase-binding transcription factor
MNTRTNPMDQMNPMDQQHAPLTPAALTELRERLEQKRRRLRAATAAERGREGADDTPDTDLSTDPEGDRVDASADREAWDTGHQTMFDQVDSLAEVERALGKFALGTYGICERCGRPIPLARLRALPEARYDIQHQRDADADAGPRA